MTEEAVAAANAPVTDEVFLMLLEINHSSLSTPIRVVNNWENVTSNGNVYVAFPFKLDLPDDVVENMPRPTLEIDNVDRTIVDAIRAMDSAATVTISVVLASSPNDIEAGPFLMTLREVEYDALTVRGQLAFEELWSEPYPGDKINRANYPGLF